MSWAARRRFIILSIVGAVIVGFSIILFTVFFTKAPSCNDGVQNQGEAGVDCGGPCPYLCTDQEHAPTVLYTKALPNGAGRTDVVAQVENINADAAAKGVPYTITLYGAGQVFVQQVTGTFDLPPSTSVPVFIPGISSGNQKNVRAFLTIDPSQITWYRYATTAARPVVVNTLLGGATSTPRIDAVISNQSVSPVQNLQVIALVHDAQGEILAASQTIVPVIGAQSQTTATFTWNTPFPGTPAKIEVLPVLSLP